MSKKEIIILGKSPFVAETAEDIPILLSLMDCVAINGVFITYPQATHCAFLDSKTISVCNYWTNQTLITTKNIGKMIRAMGYKQPNLDTYGVMRNKIYPKDSNENILGYSTYSFTFALNWCIKQGYDTVYFYGIDFYNEKGYYNDMNLRNFKPCTHSEKVYLSKVFTWEASRLITIMDLNPKCYSNLIHKPISQLIKERSFAASLRPVELNL
jgi:hypothetical protein